jgi:hypothetical protein
MGRKGGGRTSKERDEISGEIGSGQAISAWEEPQPRGDLQESKTRRRFFLEGRRASAASTLTGSAAFSAARCRSSRVKFHTNGRRQCRAEIAEGAGAGRPLPVRNSVTKCAFLAPVIARRFCNGPLISQHFHWPVTPAQKATTFVRCCQRRIRSFSQLIGE